ncbi:MAG: MFS transporter, partial [Actinomycetota bacterium]
LALLAVALLLAMTTWFSASAVVPQLRREWDLSAGAAAWLTIAVQLGFVAGALVSAATNLADVASPRAVMLGGALGASGANLLLLQAPGAAWAIPLRVATGFFIAAIYPTALKRMATWFVRGRGAALGILVGALTAGSATPHLVNALGGLDWRTVIRWTSALTVAGGIVAVAVRDGPFPFPLAAFDPRRAREVFANRTVRLASLGYFGHMWELYAMWAWFGVFFAESLESRGLAPGRTAALATFAVIGVGALGCWVGGILGDRWGRTRTTALAMALSGACCLVVGALFGAAPWLVLAVGLVWGFTVVADSAQFSTMVTELADQSYVGTALTLQLALGFTLTVATIRLVPFLRTGLGWWWAFAALAPGPLLGTLAMARLRSLPAAARIAGGRG